MRSLLALALMFSVAGCRLPPPKGHRARLNKIAEVYDKGDVKAAIRQLDAYLKEYPRDDLAWTILGNAHEDEDRDQEAQAAYDKALALNSRQVDAINGLGLLHRKRGDYDEALRAYARVLELDPKHAQAYSSMAVIALKRAQDAQALEYAKKGYELDKTDPVTAANLAVAYHYNRDVPNRDRLTGIAERMGYLKIDTLKKIYSGELTVRD
jgi:tetratricopeptide (TPR) repeat protein